MTLSNVFTINVGIDNVDFNVDLISTQPCFNVDLISPYVTMSYQHNSNFETTLKRLKRQSNGFLDLNILARTLPSNTIMEGEILGAYYGN